MQVDVKFSGGIKHSADVSSEKQAELVAKLLDLIQSALLVSAAVGSGQVSVGEQTKTFGLNSPYSAD